MFDARIQFMLLLLCGSLAVFVTNTGAMALAILAIAFVLLQGYLRLAAQWFIFYFIFSALLLLLYTVDGNGILNAALLMLAITSKMLPTLIFASSLAKVPTGRLLSSLQKINVPKSILLTLAVALRFFPVLRSESKLIQENAHIRGISLRQLKNWRKPLLLFEYAIVPLLMRTIRLADDLSAAASTRGIDAPYKKTSHHHIAFRTYDSVACLFFFLLIGTLWI